MEEINALEPHFQGLTDRNLRDKTTEFRSRLKDGETLDDLLVEAFAAVREASVRSTELRHFDVQLLGGVVLHQGRIAEMKTGEGKTLVATLPAYLNALSGSGVHVVTVNDYLARRDANWMGAIYSQLGLTIGALQNQDALMYSEDKVSDSSEDHMLPATRHDACRADITYGTNNEFGFDYLRDNMVTDLNKKVQPKLSYVIVDEVDNILIDEARTPLIISGPSEDSPSDYKRFAKLSPMLEQDLHYTIDEKHRSASLTPDGIDKLEQLLKVKNLYSEENVRTVAFVENALKAEAIFERDRDYVVKDGQVLIVDEFTGRLMPGRRYSEGLHQALEAKESLEVRRESITYATVTLQNYFRLYEKLAGMTGTAATEAEEFWKIYKLDVVTIPSNTPNIRLDHNDLVYGTEKSKFNAVVNEIKDRNSKGQPVLVGTVDIATSESLSELLKKRGIKHQVLNAKHHEQEATIVAEAGRSAAVTVATNMAGRGTDIILGGSQISRNNDEWGKDHDAVVKLGGLHVIGTERHDARRIDNQLRGRAARQGDPGSTRFYISLEDDLLKRFAGDVIKSIMSWTGIDEDTPLENKLISKTLENAQIKVEAFHLDMRKHLVDYDDVINTQRDIIYKERAKVLSGVNIKENILEMVEKEVSQTIGNYVHGVSRDQWEIDSMVKDISSIVPMDSNVKDSSLIKEMTSEDIEDYFAEYLYQRYESREDEMSSELTRKIEQQLMLRFIDVNWIQHLTSMEQIRQGTGLYAFGQRDPLVMYKKQARDQFESLLDQIQHDISHSIFHVGLTSRDGHSSNQNRTSHSPTNSNPAPGNFNQKSRQDGQSLRSPSGKQKIGRNASCPCGSGKKYKKCHA
ncbi:MAG: preprotein translocase subunit SecA [Chloroflexi bacterium]|nr:MAG: preprotein translocase subunit SecA [Chloroflexota bacterium]